MPTVEDVRRFLHDRGVEVLTFEDPTPTSEVAARAVACAVGAIAKTILFLVGGAPVAVVASGDVRVVGAKLKAAAGLAGKVKLPNGEEVFRHTGYPPGGVCPFLLRKDMRVLVDRSLRRFSIVYPAAGDDHSGVPISVDALVRITGGEEVDVCSPPHRDPLSG